MVEEEAPTLRRGEAPTMSGEYRMVSVRSSASDLPAVRPAIRRIASTTAMRAQAPAKAQPQPQPQPQAQPQPKPPAQTQAPPPRRSAVTMQAVRPAPIPQPTRMLDDSLDFDIDESLDFDIPLSCDPPTRRTLSRPEMGAVAGPPPRVSRPSFTAVPPVATGVPAVDPHDRIVAFAGFGDPPATLFAAPAYARRAMRRRKQLERELADARARSSPDVGLYEAALRTLDAGAVQKGIAVMFGYVLLAVLALVALGEVALVTLRAHAP